MTATILEVALDEMTEESAGYKALKDDEGIFLLDHDTGCWIDGGIHLKAMTGYGDPVELNSTEARLIAQALQRFADSLDGELDISPPDGLR